MTCKWGAHCYKKSKKGMIDMDINLNNLNIKLLQLV